MRSSFEDHPAFRSGRAAVYLALIALLGLIPVLMYSTYRHALDRLSGALSRGTGMSVTVDDLWLAPGPELVLHRVEVSSPGLKLTTDRLVLELDAGRITGLLGGGARADSGLVRGVRLRRPRLQVTDQGLAALAASQGAAKSAKKKAPPAPAAASSGVKAAGRVVIEDGELLLLVGPRGRGLTLRSRGIYLGRRGTRDNRLLLGQTSLHMQGKSLLDFPAAAVDRDVSGGGLPVRLAAMGGRLDLLDHTFDVHLFHLIRRPSGYRIILKGATRDPEPGRFSLEAKADALHRLASVEALLIKVEDFGLERLRPLFASPSLKLPGSRVSGQLSLWRDKGLARLQLELSGDTLTASHPRLARRQVGPFPGKLEAELTFDPAARSLTLSRLEVTSKAIALGLQGELTFGDAGARLSLDLRAPAADCQKLLTSLPGGFAPQLKGAFLRGELGARGRLRLDTADLGATTVDLALTPFSCRMLVNPPRANVDTLNQPLTARVPGPRGARQIWILGPDNPDFRHLESIGRHVRAAFIAAEDNRFMWHDGFDERQLRRAFVHDLQEGRLARGASTISQQLIKNIFLHHGRTLARKFQEAVLTWRLEQRVSKERILELYLNVVEMGRDLRGVAQAARHYFDKEPDQLSILEAAHLAMITPHPRSLGGMVGPDGQPSAAWMAKVYKIVRIMRRIQYLSEAKAERLQKTKLVLKRGPS